MIAVCSPHEYGRDLRIIPAKVPESWNTAVLQKALIAKLQRNVWGVPLTNIHKSGFALGDLLANTPIYSGLTKKNCYSLRNKKFLKKILTRRLVFSIILQVAFFRGDERTLKTEQ